MNKHIELVKKWLDDPESVTQEELKANAEAAAAYADAWAADAWAAAAYADAWAADARAAAYAYAYATAAWAAEDAATYAAAAAAHWVKKYEEMTGE